MNAIEIDNLTVAYKGKLGKRVEALTGLDLTITRGEVFGFLGPNGAGKSTTIKTLLGQILPTGGTAKILGVSVNNASARLDVGYLPENPSFYDFMSAREYLTLVGRIFAMDEARIVAESTRVLELLDLTAAADRPMRGYSKGMVQRLGLAQALLHDPELFIFDEPMSGLDPVGRALVKTIIKDLKQRNKTVFFSTHITSDIEVVCDRVGVIADGKLQIVDSVRNILASGVEGYTIQVIKNGVLEEMFIKQEQEALLTFMSEAVKSGISVECIEPKRMDMESFFLKIINKDHASKSNN